MDVKIRLSFFRRMVRWGSNDIHLADEGPMFSQTAEAMVETALAASTIAELLAEPKRGKACKPLGSMADEP